MQVFCPLFNIFLCRCLSFDVALPVGPMLRIRMYDTDGSTETISHFSCHKHLAEVTACCSAMSHMLTPNLKSKPTLKKTFIEHETLNKLKSALAHVNGLVLFICLTILCSQFKNNGYFLVISSTVYLLFNG